MISTILTDQIEALAQRPATCDCGRKVELDVNPSDPYRVIRKCSCGLTSICYPLDQEGDLTRLRQWVGKAKS